MTNKFNLIKVSNFLFLITFIFLGTFLILLNHTNLITYATSTNLYTCEYDYTHYYSLNGVESIDSSGDDVTTSSIYVAKNTRGNVSFNLYGDNYTTGATLSNNGYINSSFVHIIVNSDFNSSTVKLLNSSGDSLLSGSTALSKSLSDGTYTVEYTGVGTGWLETDREYAFYKMIATFTFTIDTVKPTISGAKTDILYTNETTKISASDSLSGVGLFYLKGPNSDDFTIASYPYTLSNLNQNGLYTFYTTDKAGNQSDYYYLYLDTEKPEAYFRLDGERVSSYYINEEPIVYSSDNDQISKIYIMENDGEEIEYNSSYQFVSSKKLTLYAVDRAGNKSDSQSIYIDNSKPTGSIYINDTKTTKSLVSSETGIRYEGIDTESDIKVMYYKKSTDSSYTQYTGESLLDDGAYYFYSIDNAGNESDVISITLDNEKPTVTLYLSERVSDLTYTNLSYFKINAYDASGLEELYYIKDGTKTSYTNLSRLKTEGDYLFYAVDKAGNISDARRIVVDRSRPTLSLFVDGTLSYSGSYNKNFYLTASDSLSGVDKITYSIDGVNYSTYLGDTISNEGCYSFYAYDKCNNKSYETYVILDKTNPTIKFLNNGEECKDKYVNNSFTCEAQDNRGISGIYYKEKNDVDYSSYSSSLEMADGEYYFYAEDNAKNKSDTISIIKDSVIPNLIIYAGDSEALSNSITAKSIRVQASDENLDSCYVLMDGNSEYIPYNIGNILSEEGLYSFYAEDKAKNKSDIQSITIDKSKPELSIYIGDEKINPNTYINESFILETQDTYSSSYIYIKIPGAVSFSLYDGSELSTDGKYTFYAEDSVLNKTDEYFIYIDYTSPINKIYAQGEEINSLYTNKDYVIFSSEDSESSIYKMYVKEDDEYREYFGEKLYLEGEYSFYSVDEAGNESEETRLIIDREKPTGEIKYSSTYLKCNVPFYYIGEDNYEIDKAYIKTPVDNEYSEYSLNSYVVDLIDGTYSFYILDKANNRSDIKEIEVDLIEPQGNIYENGVIVNRKYTNKNFYYKSESNTVSFIKTPSDNDYSLYDGKEIESNSISGEYFFYSIDDAGNKSSVVSIVLDNIKPNGILYSGSKEVSNGSFVKSSISFKANSNISSIKSVFYTYKGSIYEYFGEVLEEDGEYGFYALDEAGNESELYIITIDKINPTCKFFIDGIESNLEFTNKDRISLEASDTNLDKIYVRLPNEENYIEYTNNAMYSIEGNYSFYAIDKAKNKSDEYKITIDREIKDVKILSLDENNVATKDVVISWEDNGLSKIKEVSVNGIRISNGDTINVIHQGTYNVYILDEAGNENRISFTCKYELYKKSTIYEFYEVKDGTETFEFSKYQDALDKAILLEEKEIEIKTWTDQSISENIQIDDKDKENVKNGLYYFYKSEKSSNNYCAYFTKDRLDEVINLYAIDRINHYYYFEKEATLDNEDLYQDTLIYTEINIDKNLTYYIDDELYLDDTFSIEGQHEVLIKDKFNNSLLYNFLIIKDTPTIYANDDKISLSEYYYKEAIDLSISSNDLDSVLIIKNDVGEIISRVKIDEKFTLNSGKYIVYAINHKGQTKSITIYVSLLGETVEFNEINNSFRLEIKINKSSDKYSKIESISIYKNGEKILKDDFSNLISSSIYTYTFRSSGEFEVQIEDTFRKLNDSIKFSYTFNKKNPSISISNIENTYTNQNVEVSYQDEGYVELYKDGTKIEFSKGTIKKEGSYILYFKDYDKFEEKYEFIIDKTNPKFLLDGVEENKSTNQNVMIKLLEDNLKLSILKDNEKFEYQDGDEIIDNGTYYFEIKDLANNQVSGTFIIDKEVEFTMNTLNGAISSNDVVINNLEDLNIQVLLNDEELSYTFGDKLINEGEYKVIVEDKVGNLKEVEFLIQKSKLKSFSLESTTLSVVSILKDEKATSKSPLIFTEDGTYDITLTDGENVTSFQIIIDTIAPKVSFEGVQNGGTTTGEVSIASISEVSTYKAYLNGYLIDNPIDGIFKDKGVYTIYFYDSVGNESQYTFSIEEDVNKGLIFILILVAVLVIVLTIFILIFKKKNKKIKELVELKKDPVEKEEEKHVHEEKEDEIIKEDTEEEKKEIEEKNMIISRLHPQNRVEENMLIRLNRMDNKVQKVEKKEAQVEEIANESEEEEESEYDELVEEKENMSEYEIPFYSKIIREMSKEGLYNLRQESIIDGYLDQVKFYKYGKKGGDIFD